MSGSHPDTTCIIFLRNGSNSLQLSEICVARQLGSAMIETMNDVGVAPSSLISANPAWSCRWCSSKYGVRVLDAGLQSPSDLHPHPSDPEPDPEYPLVMVMCLDCRLVQLESDPTTPEEPRGLEPRALVEQAEAAVDQAQAQGYVRPGIRVLEYPSPHGGS